MRRVTAAVLLFLPTLVSAQQRRPDVAMIEKVADSIAVEVLKAPVAGIAVGVAHAGEVIFARAYGLADVAERTQLRTDDAHQIGSLTKQFTAAAVLQLVEQGRMSLDDPIRKYLPDFETQGRTVTIHHLLNHTSGIRSYTSIYGMNPVPREAVLDTIQKHPYDFEPGQRFLYNNSGYYLLGVILEEVTGVPYAQYVEQRLFEPLGLTATSYCGYQGERVPVGYEPGAQGLGTALLSDMEFPGAAGALCSTVADLLRWQHALVTGQVVQPESYERMTTPAALASGETMNYGYGLTRIALEGRTVVAHGGGIPGFNTFLSYHPTDNIGVVVLVNTAPGHTARIHEPIARAALGLPRRVMQDLPLDSAQRARYVGTYQLPSLEVRVFERDGVLMTQATGQGVLRMKYQGEHTFLLDTPQEIRLVFQVDAGQADGFTLYQGGATVPARRIRDDQVPTAQTSRLSAQDTSAPPTSADTAAVRAWIRDHAIALTTAEAGNGFADLQPLRRIVGDARIVALGEATHGTREFFQLKHRMLEFLVSEMDFNIFAIEASLSEALDVNRYVLSGEGDPARALAGMHFWIWDTQEVLALIRWMREYNVTETSGRKVQFYGFDTQFTARAARTVLDYLRRVDPAAGSRADRVMDPLADPFVSREIGSRWPDERQQELADSLHRVVADFDERSGAYAAMTSAEEVDIVRRHLEIILQAMGTEGRSRDAAMAENVAWILGREGPDSKAVLWAHNQHVAVQEGSQGEALRRMFGDDLRVFGFAFDRGGFQARDVMVDGALRPWFVGSAPDTTLEAHLRAAAPEVALIDLRSLPEAGPVASWFMTPRTMRTIGSGYTYERPDWYWWRAPVAEVYDALVFLEETTPARANLTGRVPGLRPPTNPANLDFEMGLPGAWPLGWTMPRGASLVEWDVRLTSADAREGEQAVVIRRAPGPSYGETHAALSQRADATPWRGQRVTLRAWVRVDGASGGRGYLWLEITEPGSESVFYESTGDRPITASEWREYRITTDVSAAADVISFGFAFVGDGEAWLDGVSLERQEATGRPGR